MQTPSLWKQQATKSEADLKAFIEERYLETMRKIMNIKLATLWYRWVKTDKGAWVWDFNHLEDGHCQNDLPTPKMPIHNQTWKGGKWAKAHVQLNGTNNVVGHFLIHK
jgi:hypothetical protein